MVCEATVASAAPRIPSSGNGPTPKMSRGSNTILVTTPMAINTVGVMKSPTARKQKPITIMNNMVRKVTV